jgi:hypothetical protein
MSIIEKTPAQLIDELITTSMRCWYAQDKIGDLSLSADDRLDAAMTAQIQNAKRTELIRAIDGLLGFGKYTNSIKTYTK